ncbi:tetratricopeptide repeat protein [Kordia algicida OT-1]|uniref:TPR repeat containing protein n=1 Tax=Kordia algicida OT-1 TaxID=391587 RepID=A9EB19_9FLAO|nr:tetratricopeptide repeat protein [Kordia algicida]EDP94567.1 TPR repeat containing protein [Kordia algicida OT-1]
MLFSSNEDQNFALSKFESMLKTNNVFFFDSAEFEDIVHHYLDAGKVSLAKKAIKIGLEQHPSSVNLKLIEIELMVFENKLDEAEKRLDALYVLESSNAEIYIQKANIFSKRDEHYKAIELLKTALEYSNDQADVNSLIGMEYLFIDDFKEAKRHFMKCIEADIDDYSSLYNIIYCFEFLEDIDGAINYLNGYIDKNPYSEVAWHQLGKQYYTKKLFTEALASFDFAIIADDRFIGAYLEKGKVLEKLGEYEEAIHNYQVTLELDDPTSFAYLRMGKCYEKLGKKDLAVKFYYKTVHEDPLLDKGWTAITDFYIKQENYQKALYYINKAINIDTENVSYWKRSAEIHRALQMYEEADIAYQKTVELGNYELSTWIAWADILKLLGEYNNSTHVLLQALEFYPDNSKIEYRLAGIYFILGEQSKGTFHLKNALRNNFKQHLLFQKLFPGVVMRISVKNIISEFKKSST